MESSGALWWQLRPVQMTVAGYACMQLVFTLYEEVRKPMSAALRLDAITLGAALPSAVMFEFSLAAQTLTHP